MVVIMVVIRVVIMVVIMAIDPYSAYFIMINIAIIDIESEPGTSSHVTSN